MISIAGESSTQGLKARDGLIKNSSVMMVQVGIGISSSLKTVKIFPGGPPCRKGKGKEMKRRRFFYMVFHNVDEYEWTNILPAYGTDDEKS